MKQPAPQPHESARALRSALRSDLLAAMKAREPEVVSVLRIAIAALDNAEAIEVPEQAAPLGSEHVAGASAGVGSTEVARRSLSGDESRTVLEALASDLTAEADRYLALEQHEAALRLRRKAEVLGRYLAIAPERSC